MKKKECELTVVTAYFDIGRGEYKSTYARGNDKYINYFKFWARMKNDLVVYTQPEFKDEILEIREEYGLGDRTKIITIDDTYSILPDMYKRMCEIEKNEFYQKYRYIKYNPDNNAKYDYVMFLKSWCLKDAVEKGYVSNDFIAWLDFGFNHGGNFFSDEKDFDFTWKYDFEDKIYLASVVEPKLMNKPIFHMIQSGEVFIQGTPYMMPVKLVSEYYNLMLEAMNSLLDIGFIDDDQTVLYMAYCKKKELFNIYKCDWMMHIKKYGGKHLKVVPKESANKAGNLFSNFLYKYRVHKRNSIYLKDIKSIFLKDYLD